ncbi:hypothetical protein [Azospirillum sp. TSH7]|nr:hypothetical protein [Azospirillum sp. TSH7]
MLSVYRHQAIDVIAGQSPLTPEQDGDERDLTSTLDIHSPLRKSR